MNRYIIVFENPSRMCLKNCNFLNKLHVTLQAIIRIRLAACFAVISCPALKKGQCHEINLF